MMIRYPRDLFFICSTLTVAEKLAKMTFEGTIASIYPREQHAVAAYKAYPLPLISRYSIFRVRINGDGNIAWSTELIP